MVRVLAVAAAAAALTSCAHALQTQHGHRFKLRKRVQSAEEAETLNRKIHAHHLEHMNGVQHKQVHSAYRRDEQIEGGRKKKDSGDAQEAQLDAMIENDDGKPVLPAI